MRSGKLIATNDNYIEQFINDSNYRINSDGTIETCLSLNGASITNIWRKKAVQKNSDGYYRVGYKSKYLQLHRIIYRKFIGPLASDLTINHKDGNSLNNTPNNLELITCGENNLHAYRSNGRPAVIGNFKINQNIADCIRKDRTSGFTYKQLMKKYNISKTTCSYVCNNKIWIRAK